MTRFSSWATVAPVVPIFPAPLGFSSRLLERLGRQASYLGHCLIIWLISSCFPHQLLHQFVHRGTHPHTCLNSRCRDCLRRISQRFLACCRLVFTSPAITDVVCKSCGFDICGGTCVLTQMINHAIRLDLYSIFQANQMQVKAKKNKNGFAFPEVECLWFIYMTLCYTLHSLHLKGTKWTLENFIHKISIQLKCDTLQWFPSAFQKGNLRVKRWFTGQECKTYFCFRMVFFSDFSYYFLILE